MIGGIAGIRDNHTYKSYSNSRAHNKGDRRKGKPRKKATKLEIPSAQRLFMLIHDVSSQVQYPYDLTLLNMNWVFS